MTSGSPLGQYAALGAFIASLGAVFAAILLRVLTVIFQGQVIADSFLDNLAILGFGVLIGTIGIQNTATQMAARQLNGTQEQLAAIHARLDAVNVPPAANVPGFPNGNL